MLLYSTALQRPQIAFQELEGCQKATCISHVAKGWSELDYEVSSPADGLYEVRLTFLVSPKKTPNTYTHPSSKRNLIYTVSYNAISED